MSAQTYELVRLILAYVDAKVEEHASKRTDCDLTATLRRQELQEEIMEMVAQAEVGDGEMWAYNVRSLLDDLPEKRDWLNPDTERELRELVIEYGMSLAARAKETP